MAAASGGSAELTDASGSPETLTITGALTINATGDLDLENGSTVSAASATNTGILRLQGGSSLSVSGNLTNSNFLGTDYYCCSTGSSLTVTGTLTNNTSANFYVGTNNVPANDTDSVGTLVNNGMVYVGTGSTLKLTNQANGITDIAAGSLISNSGTISAGANNGFYKLASIEGELQLENGKSTADTATTLTIASGGTLDLQNGSSFSVANITNSGTVDTDYFCCGTGSSLTVSGTFTNNSGATFNVGTNNVPANDTDSVGILVNNGNVYVGNGSTLNLTSQSNGITDIAAGSVISVSGAINAGANNGFYKLASIEGELQLENGKSTADTAATLMIASGGFLDIQSGSSFSVASITNSGTVATDYYCCGTGASLTVSGTFTNNSGATFDVGTNNVPANDTDSVGTLVNNGNVFVGNGSTLNLTNQTNGITDIAAGSVISNSGTINAGANNAFYKLATIEGELQLENGKSTADTITPTPLTISNTGFLDHPEWLVVLRSQYHQLGHGGHRLLLLRLGQLAYCQRHFHQQSGSFYVGTNNVPADDTDSVGTLVNNGLLQVGPGSTLNLTNQPSGITDVVAGSTILLYGSFKAGSNSALANLASIEGTLELENGQSLTDNATTLTVSGSGSFLALQNASSLTVANLTNSNDVGTDYYCCSTGSSLIVTGTFTNNANANFFVGTNNVPANDTDSVGVLVNNANGTVDIGWGSTLDLTKVGGTSTNNGTINIGSSLGGGALEIDGNTTLTGTTGKVILSDFAGNIIGGTGTLTNVKNTISGSGNIGNGTMGLNNQGTIDADQSVPLIINASGTVSNSLTMEATNGATLQLDAGTYTQTTAGNILASETGNALSAVNLESGVVINGGKLTITGTTATINLVGASPTLTLNGVTISGSGSLQLPDGSTTTLLGTNSNTSTIDLNSTGDATKLVVGAASVTLNGTGKIILAANGDDIITGATSTDVLHNLNTIEGPGNIGDGNMGLVNSGVIETVAHQTGLTTIDASSAGFTNQGTVEAVAGTTLYIDNAANQFTNFNSGTSTLTGGVFVVDGILKFDGASITTDAANITLSGAAAKIENQSGANALTNLNTIASGGIFDIISQTFTTTGNFTVNGTLDVGSGAKFVVLAADSLTNFSGNTLTGGAFNVTGTLEFAGANIVNNDSSITLTGTKALIENSTNSANALAGFDNNESGATFALATKANFTTAGTFTNSGTLNIGSGSTFAVGTGGTSTLTNFSGSTLTGGTYIVAGTLQFDGANIVTNAANITLSGTTPLIKDQNGNNALANFATNSSSGSFTLASDAKITTAGAFSNAGSVLINKGSTFTVGANGAYTNSAGSTTVNGTLTVGTSGAVDITGGTLFGDAGIINGNVSVTGSSIVAPGDGIGIVGDIKAADNYTQASTASLDIDLGGTSPNTLYDVLDVTGNAGLGGTLNVDLVNGYAPKVNASFTILNYGSDSTAAIQYRTIFQR